MTERRAAKKHETTSAKSKARTQQRRPEPVGVPELDRVVHERLRLGIMSALAVNSSLTFNDLKKLLQTTDGNLSVHARKLEDAGYVVCEKSFVGRVPQTEFKLSSAGRKALEQYLDEMERVIQNTRQ
jgi:DNA-binding MarR family transcriptional regulator